MPIYEYICNACRHRFEAIVRSDSPPLCPACHSSKLEKQLSVFAVSSKGSPEPVAACGTCGDPRGPGACSMN